MKSEAYYKGERDYAYYGLSFSNNPYPSDSQDSEDYKTGINQAYRKNPNWDARLKKDTAKERMLDTMHHNDTSREQAIEKRRKIAEYKKIKDGY
jgi:hypothetical protein